MEGANSPTEDPIQPRIDGANFWVEDQIQAPRIPMEDGIQPTIANFPTVDRILPVDISREAKTLVMFGRVGNGKSALGNSILGRKEFVSRVSASGVTTECQMETTRLDDGQVVNVIDTPGLFDLSRVSDTPEYLANEMMKCIALAKDEIHGFILVCSIKTRFSIEEEGVIQSLGQIFGQRIFDYMVVVFTGGDDLDTTFPEYLSTCPSSLQTVLHLCKGRIVLFDNRTKEQNQRQNQVQQLMKHMEMIRDENGRPYSIGRMKKEEIRNNKADTVTMHGAQQKQGASVMEKFKSNLPRMPWNK